MTHVYIIVFFSFLDDKCIMGLVFLSCVVDSIHTTLQHRMSQTVFCLIHLTSLIECLLSLSAVVLHIFLPSTIIFLITYHLDLELHASPLSATLLSKTFRSLTSTFNFTIARVNQHLPSFFPFTGEYWNTLLLLFFLSLFNASVLQRHLAFPF